MKNKKVKTIKQDHRCQFTKVGGNCVICGKSSVTFTEVKKEK